MRGMTSATSVPRWWVGSYGDGTEHDPGGIWLVTGEAGHAGARRVATSAAPSFLATSPDGRALFAVGETSPGLVVRYAVDPGGGLVERERVTSGGSGPCHLLMHPSGRALYVSHYDSGSLAVLPLIEDAVDGWRFAGGIGQVFEHSGRGPHERQAGPHVHSAVLVGHWLLALDLGTDELRRYRVAPDGLLAVDGLAGRMPHGTGPRHAAVTSAGDLLVVGELSAAVYLLSFDATRGEVAPLDRLELAGPGQALPAHVTVDGDRAWIGLRGPDQLVAVDVLGDRLALAGRAPAPRWPRHHGWVGDHLVAVGEREDRVVRHANPAKGPTEGPTADVTARLDAVDAVEVPSPACILAVPAAQ
jgi:6-phosphogluconolactonase (cycloisomerase 2 family)